MTDGQIPGPRQYRGKAASTFDSMLNSKERIEVGFEFFGRVFSKHKIQKHAKVCNLSTGTGTQTNILHKLGHPVISIDGSPKMIEIAKRNAKKQGFPIIPVVADWKDIGAFLAPVKAILCCGNSFAHEPESERVDIMRQIRSVLQPSGLFIVDYRNYDTLINPPPTRELPPGDYFKPNVRIRCNYDGQLVTLTYGWKNTEKGLFSLSFYPVPIKQEKERLESTGFSVQIYSDYKEDFDPKASFYQLVGKVS